MSDETLFIIYIAIIIVNMILGTLCEIHDCIHMKMPFRFYGIFMVGLFSLIPIINVLTLLIILIVFISKYIVPRYQNLENRITKYLHAKK